MERYDIDATPDLKKWNWGAFFLSWIWGLGNSTYIAFVVFVPFMGLVWPFVLGAKGTEWAWRNKQWPSVAAFERTQRTWARWGFGVFAGTVVLAGIMVASIGGMLKSSDAYVAGVKLLKQSPEAMHYLGYPLDSGFPMGHIDTAGPVGHADISFSVSGPKGKGTMYLTATKKLDEWKIDEADFKPDNGQPIDLISNE